MRVVLVEMQCTSVHNAMYQVEIGVLPNCHWERGLGRLRDDGGMNTELMNDN